MGRRLWFWMTSVLPVVSACGMDEALGPSGAEHALDPAFDPVMSAYCRSLWDCSWPERHLLELRVLSGTPEGCQKLVYRNRDSAPNRDLDDAIADGRIRIQPSNVAACVREIDTCRPYALNDASPCGALFEGTVLDGHACQRTEECAGDAYCRSDNLQCPGVCTRRTAPGGRCRSTQECSASQNAVPLCVTSADAPRSVCTELPILEPAPLGERCARSSNGGPLVPCEPGLWCDQDLPTSAGICRRPIPLGERCDELDVCAGDAFCQGNPGVCRQAHVTREVGGPCDPAALTWCDALQSLTCVAGACQWMGDGTEGSPCDPSELYTGICRRGLHCRARPGEPFGACAPLGDTGEPCFTGSDCLCGTCQLDGTCAAGYCAPY